MKKQNRFFAGGITIAFLVLSLLVVSSCKKNKDATPAPTIRVSSSPTLGEFLVDSTGNTLYVFSPDVKGTSACSGNCAVNWPVFYTANIRLSSELQTADFGTITRADGSKQTTYKGWPLYYYKMDVAVGDTKGEKVGNVWFVAKSYSLMVARQGTDLYLTTLDGKTIYIFTPDGNNTSNCSGQCIQAWPAFYQETVAPPSTVLGTDFQTITRAVGAKQTTYKGKPLYYFANDTQRGDMKGNGVNSVWYLANP